MSDFLRILAAVSVGALASAFIALFVLPKVECKNGLPMPSFSSYFLGHAQYFLDVRFILRITTDWYKECGEVFQIWLFRQQVILTANPEDVSYILRNSATFSRPAAETALIDNCQPLEAPKITREMRIAHWKVLRTYFHPKMLTQFANGVSQSAKQFVSGIDDQLAHDPTQIFNFTPMLASAIFSSFTENVLGTTLPPEEGRQFIEDSSGFLVELIKEYFYFRFRQLFAFLGVRKRLFEKKDLVRNFAAGLLNRRKLEVQKLGRRGFNLLDVVIEMHKDNPIHQVTTASTICIASYETTSEGLTWALYEVSKDKRVEMKIQAEVDDFFSRKGEIEYEDLEHFKYLRQVWKEVLRLHPASGLMLRKVEKDVKLPGSNIIVQKDCQVGVLISSAQRNGKYVSRPDEFLPERWGPEAKESERLPGYAFLSFSSGQQACPGQSFANFVSIIFLAYLYKTYSISLGCKKEEIVQSSDWIERARSPSLGKDRNDLSWTLPVSLRRRPVQ